MTTPDTELLQQFAKNRANDAFAELVRRHINLVYSAALRQVRSPQLAEDVAQTVFLDLSRNADKLAPDTNLTAWLYRVTRRVAVDVVRSESRRQVREQISVELATMNSPGTHWTQIEPLLDEAMETLDEADRSSILLRYFENKSLREVGQTLGTSDDAAQKRVSRAVERLREYFSKNGIAVGSGGIVTLLSVNAVQAAPTVLATTISSAAAVGLAVQTTGTMAAGKLLIMTTAQKILITTTIAAAIGTGIYGMKQSSRLKDELLQTQQKQKPLTDENAELRRERDKANLELAFLREENERLHRATAELPKLRGAASLLQENTRQLAQLKAGAKTNNNLGDMVTKMMDSPAWKKQMRDMAIKSTKETYASILKTLNLTPEEQEKLLEIMGDRQTLTIEKGMAVLKGGDKKEVGKEMLADKEEMDGEIKTLLGDERFNQFKDFEKALPDKNSVAQFKKELGENPMTAAQEKQLFDAMAEERASASKLNSPADTFDKFVSGGSQKYIDAQEDRDLKLRSRATAFLNAEQLKALTDFQAKNIESLKTAMKMRESLLGDKTN